MDRKVTGESGIPCFLHPGMFRFIPIIINQHNPKTPMKISATNEISIQKSKYERKGLFNGSIVNSFAFYSYLSEVQRARQFGSVSKDDFDIFSASVV